mgnify:CR=1 FL=1
MAGGGTSGFTEVFQRALPGFGNSGSDFPNIGRLATFAAPRDGCEERTVGLEHESI